MFRPGVYPGRFARPSSYDDPIIPVTLVPGFGPGGAATFVLTLEQLTVTRAWSTEILTSYSGVEQRIANQPGPPTTRIDGSAFLLEADDRTVRTALMRAAALGSTFLVALPSEGLLVRSVAGVVLDVGSTALSDWPQPGQRAVLLASDGASGPVVVQGSTATTITVDAIPGGVTARGAHLLPVLPVLLDPQQGFARHPVVAGTWDIRARATSYGWAGADVSGTGATVLCSDEVTRAIADVTADMLIVWDRTNDVAGTSADTLASKTEVVDLGGVVFAQGGQLLPDWIRPIRLRTSSRADQQWLRGVTRYLLGAQGHFLLPGGRGDFTFLATPSYRQLTIVGDYASWYASLAHRWLRLVDASSNVQVVRVTGVVDNGDGTNTLGLATGVRGTPFTISLLELVRLESDVVPEVWDGATMTCDLIAHVVQDTTSEELVLTTPFAGNGTEGTRVFPIGNYVLDHDHHLENGVLQSGSVVNLNGFRLFCRTALLGPSIGTAIIHRNGNPASGPSGGAGFPSETDTVNAGTLAGGSGSGADGAHGAGVDAAPQSDNVWTADTHPGAGGNGGSGANAGGSGAPGAPAAAAASQGSLDVVASMSMRFIAGSAIAGGSGGAAGGGSGSQSGGGGGAGAGHAVVAAGQIINAGNITVQAIGGAGGPGAATNCGGGGGGGGGLIAIVVGSGVFPLTSNSGGAGGSGGGGSGTAGSSGAAGAAPLLFLG